MKEGKQLNRLLCMPSRVRKDHTVNINLEKSFELEKQRIVNKAMKAENKAALAKVKTHFDGVLLSQTSNVPTKMSENCSNKYHLHDKISVTQNQVNNNNIKKHNLNETYQMNNSTDYINQNKNLTEINRALRDRVFTRI